VYRPVLSVGRNVERELPEAEKNIIKKWEAEKLSEKEESKQKITEQVHRLHLVSNFEQLA
jgi:hypothetical protein